MLLEHQIIPSSGLYDDKPGRVSLYFVSAMGVERNWMMGCVCARVCLADVYVSEWMPECVMKRRTVCCVEARICVLQ